MKTKRNLFLCAALALVLLASLFGIGRSHYGAVNAEENTEEVFLKISSTNLSFDDNIYIYFRAYYDGIDVSDASSDNYGMIFWKTEVAEAERTFENAQTLVASGSAIIIEKCDDWQNLPINAQGDKKNVATYKYKVAAKEMADVIYAEPYALKGGVYYYGKTIEYSVAAYASRRLGFYHGVAGSANENFINLLNAMVNYGTLAQKYFNYNVDNLMSDVVSAGKHATLTHIEALAPTCTEAGHAEYWKCECGQLFADADGKTTLEAIPTLAPLGHDYISGICSRCEDIELTDTKFFTFTLLSDDTYSVKANDTYKSTLPKGVKVPAYYNDKPVTVIANSSFRDCSNLKILIIPDYVTNISYYAFCSCINLTSLTIPNSVISISAFVFSNCGNLKKINYLGNMESWCNIDFDDQSSNPIGVDKFLMHGKEVVDIVIPDTVTEIKKFAFCGCKIDIAIPDSVTRIGVYAFKNTIISNITIGKNITDIEGDAFLGFRCANVNYMGDIESWCKIKFSTFGSNPLHYRYSNKLVINGKEVSDLVIPNSITEIKNYAFQGCSNFTSITISNSVICIGNSAFQDCSSLTSITIPNSVTKIGVSAFDNCANLKEIVIPDSVIYIGDSAFQGCSNIRSLNYLGNLASWCNIEFKGHYSNPLYYGNDSLYYNTNKFSINGEEIKSLIIPNTVVKIKNYAFQGCSNLSSIFIPNSVISIGNYAFSNCLTSTKISLGSSVTKIGNYAFSKCKNLTQINFDGTMSEWKAITKGSGWNSGTGDYTVYCTDGKLDKNDNEITD